MRSLAAGAALLVAAACSTPYQPMGLSGGYRDSRMAPGVHFIEVSVNAYTSAGTALEYLHRRAMELCPSGYVLLDGNSSTSTSYSVIGKNVYAMTKPSNSALIECKKKRRKPAPWFCIVSSAPGIGACERTKPDCQSIRLALTDAAGGGITFSECEASRSAFCYRVDGPDGEYDSCRASAAQCLAARDIAVHGHTPITDCSEER